MRLRLFCMLPLLVLTGAPALAELGLPQVRYALFSDPRAPVEADLRRLAERGDRPSMHLLANLIANDPRKTEEAIELYRRAFDEGRGEIRALTSFARLLDRQPRLQSENRGLVAQALRHFPHDRDPQTLEAALETFLIYPELFGPDEIERLLELYQRSCLEFCGPELYRAAYAARIGDHEQAVYWYERAARLDPRAVNRYYDYLGEQRDPLFSDFASRLVPEREQLSPAILHAIGTLLENIVISQHELEMLPFQRIRTERYFTDEEAAQEQALRQRYQARRQEAQQWIQAALAHDYPPAMVARLNHILSWAEGYDETEALQLVKRLTPHDPQRAKAALAQIHIVNNWKVLDPPKAHQLITELIDEGYPDGEFLLATLYSRGSLDQPDQGRALQILQRLAESGSLTAYYRMALLYSEGHGLCRDNPRAYAYASIANDGGDRRAATLLRRLDLVLSESERVQAKHLQQQLMARAAP